MRNKRVLAYINRVRKTLGKRPLARMPKGSHSAFSCPVAKAIGYSVAVCQEDAAFSSDVLPQKLKKAGFNAGGGVLVFPEYVSRWIARFDDGAYPELER